MPKTKEDRPQEIMPVEEVLERWHYYPEQLVRRVTGRRDEDLEQICRVKFFTAYTDHYDPAASAPQTFFWNTAWKAVIDELRKRQRRKNAEISIEVMNSGEDDDAPVWEPKALDYYDPARHVKQWVLEDTVRRVMQTLPDKFGRKRGTQMQLIVWLKFYEDMEQKMIARQLRLSESTVSTELKVALLAMREEI